MPNAPNTNNYALGKGIVYFDMVDDDGKYAGERDLGNAPAFNLSVAVDKLEHFSQRSGLKSKDKTVVSQITPGVSFTLDEINVENLALMFMATTSEVSQSADDDVTFLIDVSEISGGMITGNRYLDIGEYRNIGVYKLAYDGGAGGAPLRGETLTGGTSAATAVVINVMAGSDATSGTVYVNTISGTFEDDEAVTSTTLTSGAVNVATTHAMFDTASGLIFDTTDVAISDTSAHSTVYAQTTDYTVDSGTGRVKIVSGGALDEIAADTDIEFAVQAQTYTKIMAFNKTSIEGRLRFVADNPVGNNSEAMIWRVDLSPGGEVAFIGDDWQTLEFTGEVLKDATNHPTEPYYRIETTDTI